MSMKKLFVFLIVAAVCFGNAHAQQYFDFNPNKSYVYEDKKLEVQFLYEFEGYSEKDFIVRPKVTRGNVEFYDTTKNIWVSQSDLWSNMPVLEKNMKIRVNLMGESELFFEIQNTINAEIYETPKKTIWGGDIFGNYIEKVNKNIFSHSEVEEAAISTPKADTQTPPVQQEKPPSLLSKVIKYIGDII